MNLASAFAASAKKNAQKIAVFWGDAEYSYRELWEESQRLGERLRQEFGVQPGDRVGIWLKNRPDYFPALFGAFLAGAVVVPINHFLKPPEISFQLEDADVKVLISESAFAEAASALETVHPRLRWLWVEDLLDHPSTPPEVMAPANLAESSLALIIYTSGTTGRPKGAMLTHGNLLHNVESCRQVLSAVDHDRFVLLLPMFHSFMLCVCILLPTIVGGSVVLVKSLHPPKTVIQEIIARQATILPAIPQFFRALADSPIPTDLPLRLCISGAAPLPAQVLADFSHKFPVPLLEGYGLSEASPVVAMNPIAGPWKAGSIGRPIPQVEVRVRNDVGQWLPVGEIGEICVRGGNVMVGYLNQADATAQALRDGWLLTGDVGYQDADGYFYITDRKKDMLLVNGINVYPREIEEVIYQFPGVKEAAVAGVPDARKGECPVAFVAAHAGQTVDEQMLLQFVRQRVADYKVPKKVYLLPALPRNETGKILKTALRNSIKDGGFPS
jgi:long-chain acyl-CoA synthetase